MAHRTIHVGNVESQVGEDALTSFFSSMGRITNIKLAGDPNYPTRFAFIEFEDQNNAHEALKLSGSEFAGKPLKITMAKKPITTTPATRSFHNASSDPTSRTIYVSGIDSTLTETQVLDYFSESGQITNHRFCGEPNIAQRFAFIEFADLNMASAALSHSGRILGRHPIRISPSKSAIQNSAPRPNYSHEQYDQITRTIHIAQLDLNVNEAYLKDIFERASGPVLRIALAGETSYGTRFAFIEFNSKATAQDALKLNGVLIAGKPIRVTMSRSPIMISERHYRDGYEQQRHDSNGWDSPPREREPPSYSEPPKPAPVIQHLDPPRQREEPPKPPQLTPLKQQQQPKITDLSPPPKPRDAQQSHFDKQEEDSEDDSDSGSEEDSSSDEESDSDDDSSSDEEGKRKRKNETEGPERKKHKAH